MKLTVGKRVVMIAHSVLSILLCIALALRLILPGFVEGLLSRLEASMGTVGYRVMCVALLVITAALAVAQLLFAIGRSKERAERGFINVESGDTGRVRIAVSAIEQMVRQSVRGIDGINDMKINIEGQDDAISIAVNAVVISGSHVPTLTRNMQRSIRQFVEVNCGVAVSTVSISIDAVTAQSEGIRQRIRGFKAGKGFGAKKDAPVQAACEEPIVEAEPVATPEPAAEAVEASEEHIEQPVDEQPNDERMEEPEPFDLDKPYESQFMKDLEAMKAREAAEETRTSESVTDAGSDE